MGDAKHLMACRCLVQQLADAPRRQAGNTGVDLIVDDGGQGVAVGQGTLERQHNTGKLTARGDFGQGLGVLARVGGDEEFHRILPVGGQRPPCMLEGKADARHVQEFQRRPHLFIHCRKAL